MPYNMIPYFRLQYFHVSNSALFSTYYSTSVLSFYIDVVLTLSIVKAVYNDVGKTKIIMYIFHQTSGIPDYIVIKLI